MQHEIMLIGCGNMARVHCTALKDIKNLRLVAAVDRSLERFRPMFLRMTFGLGLCGLLLLLSPLHAAPLKEDIRQAEYICGYTATPPCLDGELNDDCWNKAQASPVFHTIGPFPKPATPDAKVRFLYDKENLYIALEAVSHLGGIPAAGAERPRDGVVFGDDSMEVFLHTSSIRKDYSQFVINCDNAIFDAAHDPTAMPGKEMRTDWNPDWRHATKKRPGAWTAELAIPFAALRQPSPTQGSEWLVRIGVNAPCMDGPRRFMRLLLWPRNPLPSFHDRACSGYLIFRDRNLIADGGFEAPAGKEGMPEGWPFAGSATETGSSVRLLEGHAAEGRQALCYNNPAAGRVLPLHAQPLVIQLLSTYVCSFAVDCDKPFTLIASLLREGKPLKEEVFPQAPTKGYERRSVSIRTDENAQAFSWGIRLAEPGTLWLDAVSVERINGIDSWHTPMPEAHPSHRLDQLAGRRPFQPDSLLARGEPQQSERVIFKDTATGAWIWRLTETPGGQTRHPYMEISPWNCNGSMILLASGRLWTILPGDAREIRRLPRVLGPGYTWDRKDPDILYDSEWLPDGGQGVYRHSMSDGKRVQLKVFEGAIALWPASPDNRYLLVLENFPKAPYEQRSRIHLLALDGGKDVILDPKGQIHQLWFTKLPDHSVEFEYEHRGYSRGEYREGNFMMTTNGAIRRIFGGDDVPQKWAGHRAHSPSGKLMCPMYRLQTVNKLTGEVTPLADANAAGVDHMAWESDDLWLAGTMAGYPYLIRFAADGRGFVHVLGAHNSSLFHGTYLTEPHPAMSPDGTKLGYASSMLGDIDFYFIVMKLPDQPERLTSRMADGAVELAWEPPAHAKEIAGYLVYRSIRSGGPFELITRSCVETPSFKDAAPAHGQFYYRVSSLERSGLESLPSNETCSDSKWSGNVRHVFEAEFAPVSKPPAMEAFDMGASGFYCLDLGYEKPATNFSLPFAVPRDGKYSLWLRAKNSREDFIVCAQVGSGKSVNVPGKAGDWEWLPLAEGMELTKGPHALALRADAPHVYVDQLVVADELSKPETIAGADTTPPPVPGSLAAAAESPYVVRLKWDPVSCADFHHYNVYHSRDPSCGIQQENLVASPSQTTYLDWGRMAGSTYRYRVTAVDRAGNESKPSDETTVTTPAIPDRLFARFEPDWRTKETNEVTVSFVSPGETDVVFWTKWVIPGGKKRVTEAGVQILLDGKPLGRQVIRFWYVSRGHVGAVPGHYLWNFTTPVQGEPGQPGAAFRVGKGEHTLTLRMEEPENVDYPECMGIVLTNDRGFLPEDGFTSYLKN